MQTSKLLFLAAGAALLLPSAPAAAQTVRAGMTESQVRSALGEPAAMRRSDDGWSYLFYLNGCAVRCGSDDVVFLQEGRVVTAVFRTGRRRFAGPAASSVLEGSSAARARPASSGAGARPAASSRARAVEPEAGQATVTGIRVTLPGSEDMSVGGGQAGAGASGRSGITVYPDEARRQELTPVAPRGVIIIRDALGTEVVQSDTALDRTRQERERNVTPRTARPDDRDAPVADSSMTPATRERERAVAPRTVRPRPR